MEFSIKRKEKLLTFFCEINELFHRDNRYALKTFWNITSTSLTEENAAKKLFFLNALLSKPVHFIAWNYCLSGGKIFQLKTSQSYLIVWYTKQRNSWSLWKKNNFCEWWLWIDPQIPSTIPTQYVLPTFLCLNLKSLEQEAPVPWIVLRKAGDILWSYHKKRIFNSPGSTCLMILAKVILKIPHYDIQSWLPLRAFIFSVCD